MLAVFVSTSVQARSILGIDGEEATSVGIYIKDIRSGKVIIDHNSQMALTPASILKCVTTATALRLLGPDYTFTTAVNLRGSVSKGVLEGDLLIDAAADPTLESSQFKDNLGFCSAVADALKSRGITKIDGDIVVSQTLADAGPIAQWEIEDVAYPYGAGLFGLNWRDNTFTLFPVSKATKPYVPGLDVVLRQSTAGNELLRGICSDRLIVQRGDISNKRMSVSTTMPDPAAVLRAELKEKLSDAGIAVTGRVKASAANCQTSELIEWESPDAATIMRSLMVRSDNLFAEGMLRAIAPDASRKDAIKKEKSLWESLGVNARYTIINDGSGLTRANRLSPRFMASILENMAKSKFADTYVGFFPRTGVEGTVKSFLAKTSLKGKFALKTGSVSAVQCYAGYKLDDSGKPTHVVVFMVNGFFCERAAVRAAVEKLLLENF